MPSSSLSFAVLRLTVQKPPVAMPSSKFSAATLRGHQAAVGDVNAVGPVAARVAAFDLHAFLAADAVTAEDGVEPVVDRLAVFHQADVADGDAIWSVLPEAVTFRTSVRVLESSSIPNTNPTIDPFFTT